MDLTQLLGKLDLIEGSMEKAAKNPTGPKFTGQWKGTDAGTPGRKLVGNSLGFEENILKDLSKGPTPKTKEQELAEQFEQFLQQLEEENLGVDPKRPQRPGSRPGRDYGKDGEHSKRYNYEKVKEEFGDELSSQEIRDRIGRAISAHDEETADWGNPGFAKHFSKSSLQSALNRKYGILKTLKDKSLPLAQRLKFKDLLATVEREIEDLQVAESKGNPHKILANKLKDIERQKNQPAVSPHVDRAKQAKADYAKYVAKMKKKNPDFIPLYKIDEYGADQPQGTAGQTSLGATQPNSAQQMQQAKNVQQATQTLKAATGSTAPTMNLAKAIDAASQGKAVDSTSMKALEPLMKDVATVASDPKIASQFKNVLAQVQQKQQKQQQIQSSTSS